jgi:hypothetical protein
MTAWDTGSAEVKALLAEGRLQAITGAAADGTAFLERADQILATAERVVQDDPESAYVLAYSAARQAAAGLLAQQGLRATTAGGHYVIEQVLRAQFGQGFHAFGTLRRRRNEMEYPDVPESIAFDEAKEAVEDARGIIAAAKRLLPRLGFFR